MLPAPPPPTHHYPYHHTYRTYTSTPIFSNAQTIIPTTVIDTVPKNTNDTLLEIKLYVAQLVEPPADIFCIPPWVWYLHSTRFYVGNSDITCAYGLRNLANICVPLYDSKHHNPLYTPKHTHIHTKTLVPISHIFPHTPLLTLFSYTDPLLHIYLYPNYHPSLPIYPVPPPPLCPVPLNNTLCPLILLYSLPPPPPVHFVLLYP